MPGELAGCCGHTFSALFPFLTRPHVCIYFQVTLSKKDIFRNMAVNASHFLVNRLSSIDAVFRDIRAQWCLGASELTLDPLGSSLDEAMMRSGTLPKTGTQRLIFFSSRYVLFLLRRFMTDRTLVSPLFLIRSYELGIMQMSHFSILLPLNLKK